MQPVKEKMVHLVTPPPPPPKPEVTEHLTPGSAKIFSLLDKMLFQRLILFLLRVTGCVEC